MGSKGMHSTVGCTQQGNKQNVFIAPATLTTQLASTNRLGLLKSLWTMPRLWLQGKGTYGRQRGGVCRQAGRGRSGQRSAHSTTKAAAFTPKTATHRYSMPLAASIACELAEGRGGCGCMDSGPAGKRAQAKGNHCRPGSKHISAGCTRVRRLKKSDLGCGAALTMRRRRCQVSSAAFCGDLSPSWSTWVSEPRLQYSAGQAERVGGIPLSIIP